jgi:hypothetical protein
MTKKISIMKVTKKMIKNRLTFRKNQKKEIRRISSRRLLIS